MGRALEESDPARALQYYERSYALYELFTPSINYSSHAISMIYLAQEQYQESAQWYFKFIKDLLDFPYDLSSHPLFGQVKLKLDASSQIDTRKKLIKSIHDHEYYPELSHYPEYKKSVKLMEEFIS